jgi:hypothetical protein
MLFKQILPDQENNLNHASLPLQSKTPGPESSSQINLPQQFSSLHLPA